MEVSMIYEIKKNLRNSINLDNVNVLVELLKTNINDVKEINIISDNEVSLILGYGLDNDITSNYSIFNDTINEWLQTMDINIDRDSIFEIYDVLILNHNTCILKF